MSWAIEDGQCSLSHVPFTIGCSMSSLPVLSIGEAELQRAATDPVCSFTCSENFSSEINLIGSKKSPKVKSADE